MSQRKKILLVFTLTILIFAGSALALSWGFFQHGLQIIEETELTEYGQRFLSLPNRPGTHLGSALCYSQETIPRSA